VEHYTDYAIDFLNKYGSTIMGLILAFFMALWRTAKDNGKADWLESFMCAGLTLGISSALSYFSMPETLAVGIGAFVGYLGTHKVSRIISKKIDTEESKNEND
jgi:Phage holin family (Lysis protein S).